MKIKIYYFVWFVFDVGRVNTEKCNGSVAFELLSEKIVLLLAYEIRVHTRR